MKNWSNMVKCIVVVFSNCSDLKRPLPAMIHSRGPASLLVCRIFFYPDSENTFHIPKSTFKDFHCSTSWRLVVLRLSPCLECSLCSFGNFPGVWSLKADVSELNVGSIVLGDQEWSPRTMEPTLSSGTSAFKLQTPGKFPKEHRLHHEGWLWSVQGHVLGYCQAGEGIGNIKSVMFQVIRILSITMKMPYILKQKYACPNTTTLLKYKMVRNSDARNLYIFTHTLVVFLSSESWNHKCHWT